MAETSLPNSFSIDNLTFAPIPVGGNLRNISGQVFGRLTVLGYKGSAWWWCLCVCGNITTSNARRLTTGATKSCGCWGSEASRLRATTHGQSKTPEYNAWRLMIQRCEYPKDSRFVNYGQRGISVCARWRMSFENFLVDMGRKPTPQHSLDRINNDGNYEPGNCRWATAKEQGNNRRPYKKRTK